MKCWVCFRQAKGFGHVDLRFKVGHPKRYPIDWIFCSLRCQACFHRLYAVGVRYLEREGQLPTGADVIDPSDAELAASPSVSSHWVRRPARSVLIERCRATPSKRPLR